MSEYPSDYPQAPAGSSLDLVFRAMHQHGFEFGDGEDWQCPVHDDSVPSCGIKAGDNKAVLVSCRKCITRLESSALFAQLFADNLGIEREWLDTDPDGAPKSRLLNPGERHKIGATKRARRRVGTVEASYEYTDESGQPVQRVDRMIDVENGKKFFRQFTFTPEGWQLGIKENTLRPVYQLPAILAAIESSRDRSDDDALMLHFVEGEKSVHAAGAAGLLATCVSGGSNCTDAVLHKAISQLAGVRFVTIIADNDHSGFAFALRVAREFQSLDPKPTIRVVRSATSGEGDDIVEHLAAHTYDELVPIGSKALKRLAANVTVPAQSEKSRNGDSQPKVDPAESTPAGWLNESVSHWPSPDQPMEVAALFDRRAYAVNGARGLLHWNDEFYAWDAALSRWLKVERKSLRSRLYKTLRAGFYMKAAADGTSQRVPWTPNRPKIDLVLDALEAVAHLGIDVPEGSWLDGREGARGRYVHFRNGHLDVSKDGSRSLIAPSPLMFNLNALPFDYEPEGDEPT